MKTNILLISALILLSSCGKKNVAESHFFGEAVRTKTVDELKTTPDRIDERSCIDGPLNRDLEAGESVLRLAVNTDLTFCNGIRMRLKVFQFTSKIYRAYGFIQSYSRQETCLKQSASFTHNLLLGSKGMLEGNEMKILLGGHQIDENNRVVPSDHKLQRYVKFDWGQYNGEMAFWERGKVRCWAIQ